MELQDITEIVFVPGYKCNYAPGKGCRMCILSQYNGEAVYPELILNLDKVLNFVHRTLQARSIYSNLNEAPLKIPFIGGETLLYLDKIKPVINSLAHLYPRVSMIIYTNGLLLNDEMVEYFNEKNIKIQLSYEGEHTDKIRGSDIFRNAKFLERFKKLNRKDISLSITAYSQHLRKEFRWIADKLGYDIPVRIRLLSDFGGVPSDLCDYDYRAFDAEMKAMIEKFYFDHTNEQTSQEIYCLIRMVKYVIKRKFNAVTPYTNYRMWFGSRINVDIEGNVLIDTLHRDENSVLGTVDDSMGELTDRWNDSTRMDLKKYDDCETCDVWNMCRSILGLKSPNGNNFKTCKLQRIFLRHLDTLADNLINYTKTGKQEFVPCQKGV